MTRYDWQQWLAICVVSVLIFLSPHTLDSYLQSLPSITVTPGMVLGSLRVVGLFIAPIAGFITIYTFLSSSSSTEEQFESILGELDEVPTGEELGSVVAENSYGEDPLESAEVLISFIIPPGILEDMDDVYRENSGKILSIANGLRPEDTELVEYHHPLPLAFEIGAQVTTFLDMEIEDGVQGNVLSGVGRYLTCTYFGLRAMRDANISIETDQ